MDGLSNTPLKPFDRTKGVDFSKVNLEGFGLLIVPERYQQPGMPKVTIFKATDLACNLYGNGVINKLIDERRQLEIKLSGNQLCDSLVVATSNQTFTNIGKELHSTFQDQNERNIFKGPSNGCETNSDVFPLNETPPSRWPVVLTDFNNQSISQATIQHKNYDFNNPISKPVLDSSLVNNPISQKQVPLAQCSFLNSSFDSNPQSQMPQLQVPFMDSNLSNNLLSHPQASYLGSKFGNNSVNQPPVSSMSANYIVSQIQYMASDSANNPVSQPQSSFNSSNSFLQGNSSFVDPDPLRHGSIFNSKFGNNPQLPYMGLNFAKNQASPPNVSISGSNLIPHEQSSLPGSSFGNNSKNHVQNYHCSNIGTTDEFIPQPLMLGNKQQKSPQRSKKIYSSNISDRAIHSSCGNGVFHGSSVSNNSSNLQFNSSNSNHLSQDSNLQFHRPNFYNDKSESSCTFQDSKFASNKTKIPISCAPNIPTIPGRSWRDAVENTNNGFRAGRSRYRRPRRRKFSRWFNGLSKSNYR